jgi:hypothetical protein
MSAYDVNFDKNKWNKMIDTSLEQRVYDMDTLDEESNYIEEILSKAADKWTDKEKVMVANAYKYAAETGDTKMFDLILQGCMTEEVELVGGDAANDVYEYTISFDQEKVYSILGELDEVDDVSYYNLLYRISLYSQTGTCNFVKGADLSTVTVKGDVEFNCEVDDDGIKSVSLICIGGAETIERLDFSNAKVTNSYFEEIFDVDYIRSLEESMAYCESQTDVDILSNLYNRNYYELSKIDPTSMSSLSKMYFTCFVNNLTEYGTEDDDLSELRTFINDVIKLDDEKNVELGNYEAQLYMEMLSECTLLYADFKRDTIFELLSLDAEEVEVDGLNEISYQLKDDYALYALWTALDEVYDVSYWSGYSYDYMRDSSNYTFAISEIDHTKCGAYSFNFMLKINDGVDVGKKYYTSKKERRENYNLYREEFGEQYAKEFLVSTKITIPISVEVESNLYDIQNINSLQSANKAYDDASLAKTKASLDFATNLVVLGGEVLDTPAGAAISGIAIGANALINMVGFNDDSKATSNAGKGVSKLSKFENSKELSSYKGMLHNLKYLSTVGALAGNAITYNNADSSYESKIDSIKDDIVVNTMGSEITISINSKTTIIGSGVYDPRTIVSLNELEKEGIAGIAGEDAAKEIKKRIFQLNEDEEDEENDDYEEDYEDDPANSIDWSSFETQVTNSCEELAGREDEVYDCIRMLLYGNDWDNDGVIDYETPITEIDPLVLSTSIKMIDEKNIYNIGDYIFRED